MLHLPGNDKVIVSSLTFLANICAQMTKTEKEIPGRGKIVSLSLLVFFFCPFPDAALKQANFTDDCCSSEAIPNNNLPVPEKTRKNWRRNGKEKETYGGEVEVSTGQEHPVTLAHCCSVSCHQLIARLSIINWPVIQSR